MGYYRGLKKLGLLIIFFSNTFCLLRILFTISCSVYTLCFIGSSLFYQSTVRDKELLMWHYASSRTLLLYLPKAILWTTAGWLNVFVLFSSLQLSSSPPCFTRKKSQNSYITCPHRKQSNCQHCVYFIYVHPLWTTWPIIILTCVSEKHLRHLKHLWE